MLWACSKVVMVPVFTSTLSIPTIAHRFPAGTSSTDLAVAPKKMEDIHFDNSYITIEHYNIL